MRLFFFGDGYNDEKMLIAAGLGLVMANLKFKSKLSHLEVISTNDDDGVAKLLSDRVLNRKTTQNFLKIKKNCFYRFKLYFV
jgi:hydroxymethylpyrimidine pyrophosphatase-like HAD family hydrolase